MRMTDETQHLRDVAIRVGVDPDAATRAAAELAADRDERPDLIAAAMAEQLDAGVDLAAAVSSLRSADPDPHGDS
jgi:hypothetical protein